MKTRSTALFLALLMVIALAGCAAGPAEESPSATAPAATASPTPPATPPVETSPPETVPGISVVMQPLAELLDDEGILVYCGYYTEAEVSIAGAESAAERISRELTKRLSEGGERGEELFEAASERYRGLDEDMQAIFMPYTLSRQCEVKRGDGAVLSVLCTDRAYDGTAQGSDSYYGMSFSTQSGAALRLGDVFPDTGSLRALVRDAVLAQVEQLENAGEFTGVREFVDSALDGEGWYLTGTGLGLKAAAGEIAPAELGELGFEVPYTELEGLILSQYVPVEAGSEGASGPEAFSLGFDAPAAEPVAGVLLDREAESFYLTARADTAAFTLCGVGMGESFYVAYGQAPADEGFTARRGYVWVNGLSAGESVEVQGYFNDLPNYGLEFSDGRLLLLAQSGKDGSLLIYEE